eukprot:TRINITY_DN9939_c0_g1_i3.p2 TRINITY_DN9939_c0_g1~~TRINITY_DN9939_c0_g1_i3.p2  ORF type:complete len:168 (-),score=40.04 TRINITY_DN9939_c0_g1_i3:168-671(-)
MSQQARGVLTQMGYTWQHNWPILQVDPKFSRIIFDSAKTVLEREQSPASDEKLPADYQPISAHCLGNVSKDSLYAECSEENFTSLRASLDVGSSEMEFSTIARLALQSSIAANDPVKAGMVVSAVGIIPGESFGHDHVKESRSVRYSILSVLESLHAISVAHRSVLP